MMVSPVQAQVLVHIIDMAMDVVDAGSAEVPSRTRKVISDLRGELRDAAKHPERGRLVLQRGAGERVAIGGLVDVTVTDLTPARVRLVVEAPRSIEVWRGEIVDRRAALTAAARAELSA